MSINNLTSKQLTNKSFILIGLLGIILYFSLLNPEKHNIAPCLFQQVTGHSCLTCGFSRSIYSVAHLHLTESVTYHLMGPISFVIVAILIIKLSFEIISKRELRFPMQPKIIKFGLIIFFGIWLSYGIIRFVSEF